ncbi:choice-of-anchor B family protein [Aestuariivivens insulae]|uniref:choice-of-anchor B family protein n=1 Tax=Aestuariivivens insulae TaxID=1621988 RepID=UPI001F588736|nr:choice-of-anchor B family protein [Aestuariivivens insulae]
MKFSQKKITVLSLGLFLVALVCLQSCHKESVDPVTEEPTASMYPCENGFADIYPCNGFDLMAHIPLATLNASSGSDCWGWTDASTGKEYALICLNNGTAFIDISNTKAPIYLGKLPTETINNDWRDVKVYNNHAYIVADNAGDYGMQVFDLTQLRNVSNPPEIFTVNNVYTNVGSCHNVIVNENNGVAYLVGCDSYGGGPIFIDISNPQNPVELGGYADLGYTHDAQVVTYNGPDVSYQGKEIFVGSNENEVVIVDVSDKTTPQFISKISYNNFGYAHQGWFTKNMKYFIVGDEEDEISFGNNTRTIVFDFTDLDNPVYHMDYLGPSTAIDHNGYVQDDYFFQANYRAGMRVLDLTNISNKTITELGFFDTYPENNTTNFDGAWSVYPYFPSGNIIISDINRGLFVVRKSGS